MPSCASLIAAGGRLGDEKHAADRLRGARLADAAQTTDSGTLSLVGQRTLVAARRIARAVRQQPIDAASLLLASETALSATGTPRYRNVAEMAYGWFLGDNDMSVSVAIPCDGSCHDGLDPRRA